ncbi:hypothetical protein TVAG_100390 [Trichomonas vaginalis G3]|uniref:DUF3447 domain-containing protein n=1 Tax=Trichomonas vaginalis (strain ATCC PRA-98 / G3) TaxID=412133 RepID=A2ENL6_TRIV3|nr:spectrin binding [Trichomonas vaginalis G3]EAY05716.1 hypothetical protein TVAG_100390 [Trichomonas vaginalis G3]KAI5535181.1 spectrin binding [Trichomonas vaginalis G3]|eukprot:XP_001317939.1 hypothetical protein [Trichomonas vaginalis G3]
MDDDKELFISYASRDGFDANQMLEKEYFIFYPEIFSVYNTLLELYCYYGSVNCFKFLRSKYNSKMYLRDLERSFLGGNPAIINECLKFLKPDQDCMEYAIILHNIDFITYLKNEYDLKINLDSCCQYNNLQALLIYLNETQDIKKCFIYSSGFNIPSICEYFLNHGADVNEKEEIHSRIPLHFAAQYNCKEIAEILISHGSNIDALSYYNTITPLFNAVEFNSLETADLLLSHGADIAEFNINGIAPFTAAIVERNKEMIEIFLSHCSDVNIKFSGITLLHYAVLFNSKELAELLISKGVNVNKKDKDGRTALYYAESTEQNELIELLMSNGADVSSKD